MTEPNFDTLAERLRERIAESSESDYDTICGNRQATLTAMDRGAGYCTQCRTEIDGVKDDEDLFE